MHPRTFAASIVLAALTVSVAIAQTQDQSWTSTSQQGSPGSAINPTRTHQSHSESNGRIIDKTTVEHLGPDGRYVPFSDTERETVRVNDTTVRTVERTYGRDADGRRTMSQEQRQESRSLPGGEQSVTRSFSSPDSNGSMQVTRRESEHSSQISPGVHVTTSTVQTPDMNGGFSASLRTEQRDTRASDGTVQSRKSTLLPDGNGGWQVSEVRETTTTPEGSGARTTEERVLRPDSDGKLSLVERRVDKESDDAGEKRETKDTYSTTVPGEAGDSGLQLVRRETTVRRPDSGGGQTTTTKVEQPQPGSFSPELHVTEQAIDIVRPGANGTAKETHTISTVDAAGNLNQVSVDMGKTTNPSAVQVDIAPAPKSK